MPILLIVGLLITSTLLPITNAHAASALWGDEIDQPLLSVEEEFKQQQELKLQQDSQNKQQTVCELFTAQPLLSSDTANWPRIQEDIARNLKVVADQYEFLLASPANVDKLYVKYRELYMQTYCITASTTAKPGN